MPQQPKDELEDDLYMLCDGLNDQLRWLGDAVRGLKYAQDTLESRWKTLALVQPPSEASAAHLQQVVRLCHELSDAKAGAEADASKLEQSLLALNRAIRQQQAAAGPVMPVHWPGRAATASGLKA